MKQGLYLSTEPAPQKPSWKDHQATILQIVAVFLVMLLIASATSGVVRWVTVVVGLVFMALRGFQLNQAFQPPVLGVEPPVRAVERRPQEETTLDMPSTAEGPQPAESTEESVVPVGVGRDSYNHRAHALLLLEGLLSISPVLLMLWGFAALQPIMAGMGDQKTTQGLFLALAVGALVVLTLGKLKPKLKWMLRTAKGALVTSLALAASVTWTEALVLITLGLFLAGTYVLLRTWAKWYYTRYIVTKRSISIERKIPWYYFMDDSKPVIPAKQLSTVTAQQSPFEKFLGGFGVDCGSFEADTPGQKDNIFHEMRRIREHSQLERILLEKVLGK